MEWSIVGLIAFMAGVLLFKPLFHRWTRKNYVVLAAMAMAAGPYFAPIMIVLLMVLQSRR